MPSATKETYHEKKLVARLILPHTFIGMLSCMTENLVAPERMKNLFFLVLTILRGYLIIRPRQTEFCMVG